MNGLMLLLVSVPNCSDPQTQSDMTQCAVMEYVRADAALSLQWSITATEMRRRDKDRTSEQDKRQGYYATLLASQRAWLAFRDTQCVVEGYEMRGGSGEPMLVAACKAELTRDRVTKLKQLAEEK